MLLQNQVALVTGAGRGIGRAIAEVLAKEGAHVAACGLTSKNIEETCSRIQQKGGIATPFMVDVRDSASVRQTVNNIIDKEGRIDILVNNAGITKDALLLRMKDEDWDEVLSTNLRGAFYFTRAVLKFMIKNRSGNIVNISSVMGLTGNAGQSNYSASKAGLIGLSKSVAKEVASRGVRVNAVAPGFIDTDMTGALNEELKNEIRGRIPLGFFGAPEDIANTVVYLCSNLSRYVTGQTITVDGGMMI